MEKRVEGFRTIQDRQPGCGSNFLGIVPFFSGIVPSRQPRSRALSAAPAEGLERGGGLGQAIVYALRLVRMLTRQPECGVNELLRHCAKTIPYRPSAWVRVKTS